MLRTSGAIAGMVLLLARVGNVGAAENPPDAPAALADAVRGGWVTDIDGVRHIFILKVLDGVVTGIYCDVDCGEPAHLSLLEAGSLASDGVRFQIHWLDGRAPELTDVVGRIVGGELVLTLGGSAGASAGAPGGVTAGAAAGASAGVTAGASAGTTASPSVGASAGARQWTLRRDPRKPALVTVEEMFARRGITSGPLVIGSPSSYTAPGPSETLTPSSLEGLWVWSTGPARQNFIFRQVGERIAGVVCGPCDNPYTFGVIDNVAIHGNKLTFDINHQDWGIGIEYGPFANHVTVTVARHEMHLHSVQHNGPRTIEGDMVLIGPLR